jgi:hypothetical protein
MRRAGRRTGGRLACVSLALALAVMAFGAAGCDTYHYYDMDLMFSSAWGGITSAGAAQLCKVTVSGADSHDFNINNCGLMANNSNYPDVGVFEFATFADSGQLTFTVNAYNGTPPTAACLFGTGTTTMNASSQITQMGTITVAPNGQAGCPNGQ